MLKRSLVSLWILIIKILHNFSVDPGPAEQAWPLAFLITNDFAATHTIVYEWMLCCLAVADFAALNQVLTYVTSYFYCALLSSSEFFVHLICLALNFLYFFNIGMCGFYLFLKLFDKLFNFFLCKI